MSIPRARTVPDFAEKSIKHKECLADRDTVFKVWQYNVVDHFKGKSIEEIRSILRETSFSFSVLFENWCYDFNISTGIRNANAFNAREVFYIGDKKWDKRGAQGVYNYMDIHWLSTIEELVSLKDRYTFVGVDNIEGAQSLNSYEWKDNSLMIFGSEGVGLTPGIIDMCDDFVYIKQYGSVRSLNVGTASGIIMNDFVTRYRKGYAG